MTTRARRACALVVAAAAGCGGGGRHDAPAAALAPPARPRLVVLVVVDQLPTWTFERKARRATAGVRRLMDAGVHHAAAEVPFGATATAAGHAALVTGAPPAVTGVIGNTWYDRESGRAIEVVDDDGYPTLAVAEPIPGKQYGGSPHRVEVEALGDALVRARAGARVVSVSLKPRAAILMGGQRPTMVAFYDKRQTAFTTTSYYARELPGWMAQLAREKPIRPRLAGYVWTAGDPAALAADTGLPDDAPGEVAKEGFGTVFPHRLGTTEDPTEALIMTPLADELVAEAALAAIAGEGLGADEVPDLLCVSFSAHDYAGHTWGPDSWESADLFARFDHTLARLLDGLDAQVGRGNWAMVFTSDHGGTPVPEQTGGGAMRVDPTTFGEPLERAAQQVAGPGDWVAFVYEPWIHLTPAALALPEAQRGRLLDALVAATRAQPGVGVAMRTDLVRGDCDARRGDEALVCRAAHERAGEIYYCPAPGSVAMHKPYDASNHISLNESDRKVPIVVYRPGASPRVSRDPASTLQVAATLADMLGVPPPQAAERRDPLR